MTVQDIHFSVGASVADRIPITVTSSKNSISMLGKLFLMSIFSHSGLHYVSLRVQGSLEFFGFFSTPPFLISSTGVPPYADFCKTDHA